MARDRVYTVVRELEDSPEEIPESGPQRSLLSRPLILDHYRCGNIIIYPFDRASVNTTSVDARLGAYFFRETRQRGVTRVFNPFDESHVRRYWGEPQLAVRASKWMRDSGQRELENIADDDFLIVIEPSETILAHSCEFIGGRNCVTTEMRARSSVGRVGITVCKCAGWGDIGFCNRWTMEVTNLMDNSVIVLPVGMRVAQIAFYAVDPVAGTYATEAGKYQTTDDVDEMIRGWSPFDMLPRLFRDRDIGHFREHIPADLLTALEAQD